MTKPTFHIVSDGSCDLPLPETEKLGVDTVRFLVSFDGEHYKKEGLEVPLEDFYQKMVDEPGTYPMTAAPSPDDFCQYFEKYAAAGEDVLCICISTKLSSSLQSARIAAQMTEEAYPNARIILLDSLCATLMQSALVLEACRLRDAGLSVEEAARILTDLRKTARIFFTVGSFDYIQHGGRVGKMTGLAGALLNVKPLITLQDGEIHSSGIRRGRRRSLEGILELLCRYLKEENCTPKDCIIIIGYGHDREEGFRLRDMTQERFRSLYGESPLLAVHQIGATIGVHAGPTSIGYGVVCHSSAV
ncbi:DegV family protein [Massilistercora timonensis]|uniref:DegV family protein n=1 Tax=Massilistercora timonensis TaxID=2086584 RepID=UPI003AB8EC0A